MWWIRALTVLLLQGLAVFVAAGPASAHSELVSSSPAAGATLDRAPTEVELVFGTPVQNEFVQVVVDGPDGSDWAQSPVDVVDGTVTVPLRPLEQPGEYSVAYRIVSTDGHPITEGLRFTVAESAAGIAPVVAPAAAEAAPSTDDRAGVDVTEAGQAAASTGGASWSVGVPVAALFALIGAVAIRRRRLGVGDSGGEGDNEEPNPATVSDLTRVT